MLYTIAYISRAADHLSTQDIQELLQYSSRSNVSSNINGLLLFNEGNFFQVLEGDRLAVESLYNKIKEDSRHDSLVELFHERTVDPVFKEYSSQFNLISTEYDVIVIKEYLKRRKKTAVKPGMVHQIESFLGLE